MAKAEVEATVKPKREPKPKSPDDMTRVNVWLHPQTKAWIEKHMKQQKSKYTSLSHFIRLLVEQEQMRFPDDPT